MRFNTITSTSVALLVALTTVAAQISIGTFDTSASEHYGTYGGGGYNSYEEERPKLHLGLRVKIPAMKFELPRMSLPKVTISAKIKQPNRPRVIQLPEINLDTSSKIAPPNKDMGGYGGYGSSSSYGGDESYGGDNHKTNTFSISAGSDEHQGSYGSGGYQQQHYSQQQQYRRPQHQYQQSKQPQHNRPQNRYPHQQHQRSYNRPQAPRYNQYQYKQQMQQQQQYSSSNPMPAYWGSQSFANPQLEPQFTAPPNPDVGFNAPAYVDAQRAGQHLGQGDRVSSLTDDSSSSSSSLSSSNRMNDNYNAQESSTSDVSSIPQVKPHKHSLRPLMKHLRAQQVATQLEASDFLVAPREYRHQGAR